MGIWKTLLGSGNVVEKGIDLADKAFHTDEERATWKAKVLEIYTAYKIAQRYLMIIMCVPYAFSWFLTFCLSFFIENLDFQLKLLTSGALPTSVMMIVGFYFGGGMIEGGINAFRSKQATTKSK